MTVDAGRRRDGRVRPGRTLRFGVEEEFLLVDAERRTTAPRAELVLPRAVAQLGNRAQGEFYLTQVEGCTPPVDDAADLKAALAGMRAVLAEAAAGAGCSLVASGTAVLPSVHPLPVAGGERYARMARWAGPVADQVGGEICGCHVHLGDLERPEALELSARLRGWLPVLQALTVNSPFCEGEDRGTASSRAVHHRRWPTVGPAPVLDAPGYERAAERLVRGGTVLDRRAIYWYARPSEHLPTLEVRIADVNADPDVTLLFALLLRGLARVLLAEARAGLPYRSVGLTELRDAHRRAAAFGVHGTGLDPRTGRPVPMSEVFHELLDYAAPGLAIAGELEEVARLARRVLEDGTGADRQRAVFARRGSLADVVDDLAAVTAGGSRVTAPLPALVGVPGADRLNSVQGQPGPGTAGRLRSGGGAESAVTVTAR